MYAWQFEMCIRDRHREIMTTLCGLMMFMIRIKNKDSMIVKNDVNGGFTT